MGLFGSKPAAARDADCPICGEAFGTGAVDLHLLKAHCSQVTTDGGPKGVAWLCSCGPSPVAYGVGEELWDGLEKASLMLLMHLRQEHGFRR